MTETETKKATAKPRKKRVNLNKSVRCKNITSSKLTYRSRKTGYEVTWEKYGDEQYIDAKEIVDMNSSQSKFTHKPWIFIEDDALVEHLGLTGIYKNAKFVMDIDKLFALTPTEVGNIVSHLSKDLKDLVFDKAREAIKNNSLTNLLVIQALNQALDKNLLELN